MTIINNLKSIHLCTTFDLDKKFTHLYLPADILQSLNDLGYEHPTMIQSESLPIIVAGNDVVGQAHTGSGKTIAFEYLLL